MIPGGLLRRLDLTSLRLLIAVCEEHSLRRGAQREAISVAAASRRLGRLEQGLGIRLFTRHAKGMRLTETGDALRRDAEEIMAIIERIGSGLRSRENKPRPTATPAAFEPRGPQSQD